MGLFRSFFGWLLSYCIESIAPTTAVRTGSPVIPCLSRTHLQSDRAHPRRPRARFSSVLHALFALFGTISASFITAIEQVRQLAEGLSSLLMLPNSATGKRTIQVAAGKALAHHRHAGRPEQRARR